MYRVENSVMIKRLQIVTSWETLWLLVCYKL